MNFLSSFARVNENTYRFYRKEGQAFMSNKGKTEQNKTKLLRFSGNPK